MKPPGTDGGWRRRVAGSSFGQSAPGRWLKRTLRAREAEAWARRRSPDDPVLLIVAERDVPYRYAPFFYTQWLDWAAAHDADLRSQIRLAHLPAGLPTDTAVLHAWVQDPVRERNPVVFRQLEEFEERARRAGADIIQPVAVLSNSLRDVQCSLLTRAGVRTPRVVPVDARFAEEFGGLALPIVVRKNWGHQSGMERLDSGAEVAQWLAEQDPDLGDWVAAEYVEVRCTDGNYRKYRYILFGDRGVCRHLITTPNWEVRPADRVLTDATIAEELEFVAGRCAQHELLNAARRELGFDIAAFDYSFDGNGEMVVWEVNPYPDLSRPTGRPGEYLGESVARTNSALAALYRERLAAAR